jgi:hypothetical protein
MEHHRRLAVADGLGCAGVPRTELGQREVFVSADVIGILLELIPAVCGPLATLLLDQMIRQVRGQSLAPVAGVVLDKNTVPPPVVKDLVGIG